MPTLDEIKECWAKATPGPWRAEADRDHLTEPPGVHETAQIFTESHSVVVGEGTESGCGSCYVVCKSADAIAAAPTHIAWLVADVERLEERAVAVGCFTWGGL